MPALAARLRWPSCGCAPRGRALTQEPSGSTLRSHARRKASPLRARRRPSDSAHRGRPTLVLRGCPGARRRPAFRRRQGRRSCLPSGASAIRKAPSPGGRGATGISRTGRAQRRRCLPAVPLGGRIGEARRSLCLSALPSRRGAKTVPVASAPCGLVCCPRCGLVSLEHRSYARHGRPTALRQRLAAPARVARRRSLGRPRRLGPRRWQGLPQHSGSTAASGARGAEEWCASPHAMTGRLRKEESR
jgi:hypothetical protein